MENKYKGSSLLCKKRGIEKLVGHEERKTQKGSPNPEILWPHKNTMASLHVTLKGMTLGRNERKKLPPQLQETVRSIILIAVAVSLVATLPFPLTELGALYLLMPYCRVATLNE